jgi:metal-dependent amidase/aminoacylase/carboxypeptidase family protein
MRFVLTTMLLLVAQAAVAADGFDALIDGVEAKVVEHRRHLHRHPELSNREIETAKYIVRHLRELGIEVETGIAHTGVVGVLRGGKPGPVVALRADMDALPVTEETDVTVTWRFCSASPKCSLRARPSCRARSS